MDLTWLGTAGFIVKSSSGDIAFDPFISRGKGQPSPFTVQSFANTEAVFVGHGHFDHTYDVPQILNSSEAQVYAPGLTGYMLRLRGVKSSKIIHTINTEVIFKKYKMRAFKSSHVTFDWPLVYSTLKRCQASDCLNLCHVGLGYPKGLVQTYMFEIKNKKVLFISSAGCTDKELAIYKDLQIDFLLAPLQGHSQIQDLVAKQVVFINPKVVIPHHHDDFYPPLSQDISVEIFREKLKWHGFKGQLIEIPLFQSCDL